MTDIDLPARALRDAETTVDLDITMDEELISGIVQQMGMNSEDVRAVELAEELTRWWLEMARGEAGKTVAKAIEYGSYDLIEIGRNLALTQGRSVDDSQAAELGVYFYLLGKVARWTSAVADGRDVSLDTLFDIGIYVRMAQRIRQAGSWPG